MEWRALRSGSGRKVRDEQHGVGFLSVFNMWWRLQLLCGMGKAWDIICCRCSPKCLGLGL
jgi:hypothetical protein